MVPRFSQAPSHALKNLGGGWRLWTRAGAPRLSAPPSQGAQTDVASWRKLSGGVLKSRGRTGSKGAIYGWDFFHESGDEHHGSTHRSFVHSCRRLGPGGALCAGG